ncbi:MAG: DUF2071 domain-containing protein [Fuerstiella sp.]|nr:DUF2071 domain-containing protein [Fuerstiella sp.]
MTKTSGYQTWTDLLFAHWRVSANTLQTLLPDGLSVETFDGDGWLGMVPFAMDKVRPWWFPGVPGISWFLETNLRTYVTLPDGRSGVWFFSLDATKRLAVQIARRFWYLPYFDADLSLNRDTSGISYRGQRLGQQDGRYQADMKLQSNPQFSVAEPGTLEYFLLERYVLFARRPDGRYFLGNVHHSPYTFCTPQRVTVHQTLASAIGCPIDPDRQPDHVAFSPGVDVSVDSVMLV